MTVSRVIVTAVFVVAPVSSALATPVPFTRSTAGVTLNPSFVLCGDGGSNSPTPTSASCDVGGGTAGAASTFGSLGASATGTSDVPFTSAAATAEFNDILTVTGGAPTDYVGIYVSLAGDTAFNGEGNLDAHLIDILSPALRNATAGADIRTVTPLRPKAGTFSYFNTTSVNVSGLCDDLCTMLLALPFVDGDPEQLTMTLQATAIGEGRLRISATPPRW